MKKPTAVMLALALLGCANPYKDFYDGMPDARVAPGYVPLTEPVRVFQSRDIAADGRDLARRGYVMVGSSSFQGSSSSVSDRQLIEQATKIGAHVVLANASYSHTTNSVVPLTLPNNTTSYSTGSATAYGPGGTARAYGSSTTTTYGTQTTYIPVSDTRSNYGAAYFAKNKARLGVSVQPLSDAQRQQLQSNIGLNIDIVVDDSPAFLADVLPGDVLTAINGRPLGSVDAFFEALRALPPSSTALLSLNRGGAPLEKSVALAR